MIKNIIMSLALVSVAGTSMALTVPENEESPLYAESEAGEIQRCSLYTGGYTPAVSKVIAGNRLYLYEIFGTDSTGYVYNTGDASACVTVGVRMQNTKTGESFITGTESYSIASGAIHSLPCFIPSLPGTYKVIMVYNEDGEWKDVPVSQNFTYPTVTVSAATSSIAVAGITSLENVNVSTIDDFKYTATLKNTSNTPCTKTIQVLIGSQGGYYRDVVSESVSFKAGETKEVTFSSSDNKLWYKYFGLGSYYICLYNETDEVQLTNDDIFTFTPSTTITCTMPGTKWSTICLPFCAEIPDGMKAYTVKDATDNVLNLIEVTALERNTPYIISGDEGEYQFSGPVGDGSTSVCNMLAGTTEADIYAPARSYVLTVKNGTPCFEKVEFYGAAVLPQYQACLANYSSTEPVYYLAGSPSVRGDVNGDGSVDISDVNAAISVICGGEDNASAADVNGDGSVDISDVNAIISIICGN